MVRVFLTATILVAVGACSQSTPPSIPLASNTQISLTNMEINRDKILESHNFIRKSIGVPPLRWSSNLESLAADWASYLSADAGCTVRRRGSTGLALHKNGIGENLQLHDAVRHGDGRVEIAEIDEHKLVLNWAQQSIDFDYAKNECGVNKNCENYTQLVWRDTQVVGCAAASCPDMQQIWVCHYDPPGNYFNQKPY